MLRKHYLQQKLYKIVPTLFLAFCETNLGGSKVANLMAQQAFQRIGDWPVTDNEMRMYNWAMNAIRMGEPIHITEALREKLIPYIKAEGLSGYVRNPYNGMQYSTDYLSKKEHPDKDICDYNKRPQDVFKKHDIVRLINLKSKNSWNMQKAQIIGSFVAAKGRWPVKLNIDGVTEKALIKTENLLMEQRKD